MNTDILSVLLKKPLFEGISQKELAQQIEGRKKSQNKLPVWFNTPGVYYPTRLQLEQTSSQLTAEYKSRIPNGNSLIDLTGGFGVDSYFFSLKISEVEHCEINPDLSEIAAHNFGVLGAKNIKTRPADGLEYLRNSKRTFDWIFLDPARRDELKGKVFLLSDCLPDVTQHLDFLMEVSENVLIKTSPLLDITAGLRELGNVREIHVVAVENELRELLWVIQKGFVAEPLIKTVNLKKSAEELFGFRISAEKSASSTYSEPSGFLYEPNAAILKAGAFKTIGVQYGLNKLHEHSHLYTADQLITFPGRRFRVKKVLPYNKKQIRALKLSKANISTRNFPETVASLRKKLRIRDGGEHYVFFTTIMQGKLAVLLCERVS
ncbi:class I SAM-dependent methyltransferase [Poritiphilus flavus]|uniref:class I SAM-dependent methyltransferase n=1 Tax=Poritiphilus flavus TaxID=2697053 RepID=UPI00293BFEBB|nr:class I SAM-dependent methyltransferase [Poritiphilus flavus]